MSAKRKKSEGNLLTAVDLAIKINSNRSNISMAKKKGILIADEDGRYNLDNPINKAYIDKAFSRMHWKTKVKVADEDGHDFDLDVKKKRVDIEEKEAKIRLLKIKEEASKGNLIPITLVGGLISEFSRQIITSYNEQVEIFTLNFCHKNKISEALRAELTGGLVDMINKAHTKAISQTKAALQSVIEQVKPNHETETDEDE